MCHWAGFSPKLISLMYNCTPKSVDDHIAVLRKENDSTQRVIMRTGFEERLNIALSNDTYLGILKDTNKDIHSRLSIALCRHHILHDDKALNERAQRLLSYIQLNALYSSESTSSENTGDNVLSADPPS